MLFADFFPRLQCRAADRYGQSVSVRQFKGWREKGLLAGPDAPIGKGRGQAPDRHWPAQSYRRALRICRYKSHGNHHVPGWWIFLWLSGEDVNFDVLRKSLQRELKRMRRASRYLSDSGFLNSKGSTRFEDVPAGPAPNPISELFAQILENPALGLSAEINRDLLSLDFNETDPEEVSRVFMSAIKPLMGHDVSPEDIGVPLRAVWRPGHLSEVAYDYIGTRPDGDLTLALDILSTESELQRRMMPVAHAMGSSGLASMLIVIAFALANRRIGNRLLIEEAVKIIYQIADDQRSDRNPKSRLEIAKKSLRLLDANPEMFNDPKVMKSIWDEIRRGGSPEQLPTFP